MRQHFTSRLWLIILLSAIITFTYQCKKTEEKENPPPDPVDTSKLSNDGYIAATYEEMLSIQSCESIDTNFLPSINEINFRNTPVIIEMPIPGNQKNFNSCVGWAADYGMLGYYFKFFEGHDNYSGPKRNFSPSFIWNQLNGQQNRGIKIFSALQLIIEKGCCKEETMPATTHYTVAPSSAAFVNALDYQMSGFYDIPYNDNTIKLVTAWLNRGYPVVTGFNIDSSFKFLNDTQFEEQSDGRLLWTKYHDSKIIKHAMLICGYDPNLRAFKILNSWGTDWGNDGFFWLSFDFFKQAIQHIDEQAALYVGFIKRPYLKTVGFGQVSDNMSNCYGNVYADWGVPVNERGICWSTSPDPTIGDNKILSGSGLGEYTCTLTNLLPNTQYYFKAYAINNTGISYGKQKSFTTTQQLETIPEVSTTQVSNLTLTSATSGGTIISDGGTAITAKGICWSTQQTPTIDGNHITSTSGGNEYSCTMEGLLSNTTYYVRAFATNSMGTGYGQVLSFTTTGLQIGQHYGGGIIFYLESNGLHGLIAAETDQSTGIKWYKSDYIITGASGTAIGTGKANTQTIVSALGSGNYAAQLCNDLVIDGFNDWFLPSKEELNELFHHATTLGLAEYKDYWSSTESGGSGWGAGAWYRSTSLNGYGNQSYTARVRAVREF